MLGAAASSGAAAIKQQAQEIMQTWYTNRSNCCSPGLTIIYCGGGQVTQLPANFSAKEKTKKWYTDLHTKPASYTISADEERQMTYDMESSYNEFMNWLQRSGQAS